MGRASKYTSFLFGFAKGYFVTQDLFDLLSTCGPLRRLKGGSIWKFAGKKSKVSGFATTCNVHQGGSSTGVHTHHQWVQGHYLLISQHVSRAPDFAFSVASRAIKKRLKIAGQTTNSMGMGCKKNNSPYEVKR